eukprot:3179928-Amphidinium_carterae.1
MAMVVLYLNNSTKVDNSAAAESSIDHAVHQMFKTIPQLRHVAFSFVELRWHQEVTHWKQRACSISRSSSCTDHQAGFESGIGLVSARRSCADACKSAEAAVLKTPSTPLPPQAVRAEGVLSLSEIHYEQEKVSRSEGVGTSVAMRNCSSSVGRSRETAPPALGLASTSCSFQPMDRTRRALVRSYGRCRLLDSRPWHTHQSGFVGRSQCCLRWRRRGALVPRWHVSSRHGSCRQRARRGGSCASLHHVQRVPCQEISILGEGVPRADPIVTFAEAHPSAAPAFGQLTQFVNDFEELGQGVVARIAEATEELCFAHGTKELAEVGPKKCATQQGKLLSTSPR